MTISIPEHAVRRLLLRLETGAPRVIIGMAGLPGSGKTTVAARLAEAVNRCTQSTTMVALGMDGFHLTKTELSRLPNPAEAFARRGAPWTFDTGGIEQRLLLLRAAAMRREIAWPAFHHEVGDPIEDACTVPVSTRVVLVEGLYLLNQADGWQAISRLFDERWYLDTPLDVALERLTIRHMQVWGMTRSEAEARIATNDRLNAETVMHMAQYADWRLVV